MLDFLNPYRWLMALGLVGAVVLAVGVWHINGVRKAVHAAEMKMQAQMIREAEGERQKRDAKEAVLAKKVAANDKLYQVEKRKRAIADAAANGALDRLRNTLVTVDRATGQDTPAASGADDPRDRIIGECAFALVGLDKEARRLAGKVTGLQKYASEVCMKASE